MEKEEWHEPLGTLCFLSTEDMRHVVTMVKETAVILKDNWNFLVVSDETPIDSTAYTELQQLCKSSQTVEHLVINRVLDVEKLQAGFGKSVSVGVKVLEAIKQVNTKFVSFIDTDYNISVMGFENIVTLLNENINLGAVRGNVTYKSKKNNVQEKISENKIFRTGAGIGEFALFSLSSSGVIYNLDMLKQNGLLERFEDGCLAHRDYPWIYLSILFAANSETYFSTEVLSSEIGKYKRYSDKIMEYFSWRSYGRNCDQFIALRNALFEGFTDSQTYLKQDTFDFSGFYRSYGKLFRKMLPLIIKDYSHTYSNQGVSIKLTALSFSMFSLSAITKFPDYKLFEQGLKQSLFPDIDQLLQSSGTNNLETGQL